MFLSVWRFNIFLALLGLMIQTTWADTELSTLPAPVQHFIAQLDTEKPHLQGGAVAILHKGQVIYKSTFGHQKGNKGPINSHSLFPLASVSKTVSATAIALMVEDGTLDLNQEMQLPYLKERVNLKHLLSHTTGYKFTGNTEIEHGWSRKKLLESIKHQQPACRPGDCYLYSNATFSLLEEALEKKNLSLQDAIWRLKTALNTNEILIAPLPQDYNNIVHPHTRVRNKKTGNYSIKPLPAPPYYPKTVPASAGVFASLDGMIELFRLQFGYRPDLISQKTLDIFHTPFIMNNDIRKWHLDFLRDHKSFRTYYALGWRVLRSSKHPNQDLIFHGGYIKGISSFIGFIPSEDIGIIILMNQDSGRAPRKGIQLWGDFLNTHKQPKSTAIAQGDF